MDIEWTPDERTVRACIEALPVGQDHTDTEGRMAAFRQSRLALEALLPRDPVADLVDSWDSNGEDKGAALDFARWLHARGMLNID